MGSCCAFPLERCPCGRREIIFSGVCGLVQLDQCNFWGELISLSAGHKYTNPTEGAMGTWGVHL